MVLNTELLNAPQGNNRQCIYGAVQCRDGKLLPSVEAMEMERKRARGEDGSGRKKTK